MTMRNELKMQWQAALELRVVSRTNSHCHHTAADAALENQLTLNDALTM